MDEAGEGVRAWATVRGGGPRIGAGRARCEYDVPCHGIPSDRRRPGRPRADLDAERFLARSAARGSGEHGGTVSEGEEEAAGRAPEAGALLRGLPRAHA